MASASLPGSVALVWPTGPSFPGLSTRTETLTFAPVAGGVLAPASAPCGDETGSGVISACVGLDTTLGSATCALVVSSSSGLSTRTETSMLPAALSVTSTVIGVSTWPSSSRVEGTAGGTGIGELAWLPLRRLRPRNRRRWDRHRGQRRELVRRQRRRCGCKCHGSRRGNADSAGYRAARMRLAPRKIGAHRGRRCVHSYREIPNEDLHQTLHHANASRT